mgnify:CR=1 FL=1
MHRSMDRGRRPEGAARRSGWRWAGRAGEPVAGGRCEAGRRIGWRLPLTETDRRDERVAGVRWRAWRPAECLHPTIDAHGPLVIDLWDGWTRRALGGCVLHAAHPGGRAFDTQPVNELEAEGRRLARFEAMGHTPAASAPRTPRIAPARPLTLDLRLQRP